MYKLLIVADRPDWVFAKLCRALQKNIRSWTIEVRYGPRRENLADHEKFDLVFYMLDYLPHLLDQCGVPPSKLVLAIRSHVIENGLVKYLDSTWLNQRTGAVIVANKKLLDQFRKLHPTVYLAPGGTDVDFFVPGEKNTRIKPVVGWAGSKKNFGEAHRGLDIIRAACAEGGLDFRPAFREDSWRDELTMKKYYQEEIDIYVDMSVTAGRQNGLLEAGACGKLLISSRAGVAEDLIIDGWNGYLTDRNVNSLAQALSLAQQNTELFGNRIRETIVADWSWSVHAPLFETAFRELYTSSIGNELP